MSQFFDEIFEKLKQDLSQNPLEAVKIVLPTVVLIVLLIILIRAIKRIKKRRRDDSEYIRTHKVARLSCDVLTLTMLTEWFNSHKDAIGNDTLGVVATREACREYNNRMRLPTGVGGKTVLVQLLIDPHPPKGEDGIIAARSIVCLVTEERLRQLLADNSGRVVFSDMKKGMK